jgi:hypothetical protein
VGVTPAQWGAAVDASAVSRPERRDLGRREAPSCASEAEYLPAVAEQEWREPGKAHQLCNGVGGDGFVDTVEPADTSMARVSERAGLARVVGARRRSCSVMTAVTEAVDRQPLGAF